MFLVFYLNQIVSFAILFIVKYIEYLSHKIFLNNTFFMTQKLTILFDLDGTLADTAPDLMKAHNFVMDKFGYSSKSMDEIRNLVGRGAAVMIGRSIYHSPYMPADIEKVVKVLTGVEDVLAIGMKNEMYGEVIKIFVKKSINAKITKSEILSHCIKNLESFKVPREIEFVNDFSSNEFGKMKHFRGE